MKSIEVISCIADKSWIDEVFNAGADALYCGLLNKSWYKSNIELSWEDLLHVSKVVHKLGKKIYVAVNRNLSTEDVIEVLEYIPCFENGTFDGIIVSDWGCIHAIRQRSSKVHIHLSANTGCVNDWDFKLAQELKVQRIIFSPTLELEEIQRFVSRYPEFEYEAISYGMQCSNEVGFCPCHADFGDLEINNVCCHGYGLYKNGQPMTKEKAYGNPLINGEVARGLYEMGVTHFKVEGRAKGLNHIIRGTRILSSISVNIR